MFVKVSHMIEWIIKLVREQQMFPERQDNYLESPDG